jgi:hypothetical protein
MSMSMSMATAASAITRTRTTSVLKVESNKSLVLCNEGIRNRYYFYSCVAGPFCASINISAFMLEHKSNLADTIPTYTVRTKTKKGSTGIYLELEMDRLNSMSLRDSTICTVLS